MERLLWLDGHILPLGQARLPVMAPAAQFGVSVFEGVRCYRRHDGGALLGFRLDDHFDRLEASAKLLGLRVPHDRRACIEAMCETIAQGRLQGDLAVRMAVFVSGAEGSWYSCEPVSMFIAPIERPRKAVPLTQGLHACVSSWERIDERSLSPRIKVGANYVNSRMAHLEALRNGYDTALFLNRRGTVSEGTGSCIFMVRRGQVSTPNEASSVLESITQDTLVTLLQERCDIQVVRREIDRTELYTADEVFLCGSAAEITPLLSIDGHPVGQGVPGPLTCALHAHYIDAVTGRQVSTHDWLTELPNH